MTKVKKGNMFEAAAEQREQEQAKTEAAVTGREVSKGRPAAEEAKTKITLSISEADKQAIKRYALDQRTTVSDLLHDWIAEKCL